MFYDVCISSIQCDGLLNVEYLGENDPFVRLQFHAFNAETEVVDGGGSSVTWDGLSLAFSTSNLLMENEKMDIAVYDHNELRTHTHIGSARIDLSPMLQFLGSTSQLGASLVTAGGQLAGTVSVSVTVTLSKKSEEKMNNKIQNEIVSLLSELVDHIESEAAIDELNRPPLLALVQEMYVEIEWRSLTPCQRSVAKTVRTSLLPKNKKLTKELGFMASSLYAAAEANNQQEADVFLSLMFNHRTLMYREEMVYLLDKMTSSIASAELYEVTDDEGKFTRFYSEVNLFVIFFV